MRNVHRSLVKVQYRQHRVIQVQANFPPTVVMGEVGRCAVCMGALACYFHRARYDYNDVWVALNASGSWGYLI